MFFTINDEVKSELAIECEHRAYEIFLERCKRLSLHQQFIGTKIDYAYIGMMYIGIVHYVVYLEHCVMFL